MSGEKLPKKSIAKWKKVLLVLLSLAVVFASFTVYVIWDNNCIEVSEYTYESSKIPDSFSGVRILQISDWENKYFSNYKLREKFIELCRKTDPDYIFITGDMISSDCLSTTKVVEMIRKLCDIAPVYYAYGNHEMLLSDNQLKIYEDQITSYGCVILNGSFCKIYRDDDSINIIGFHDLAWYTREYGFKKSRNSMLEDEYYENDWKNLAEKTDSEFTILLSHRPECFNIYQTYDVDLIFSGHAHGGIVRLPFGNALFAPDQGFFPKYFSGRYDENNRTMFVSRGIGMTKGIFRIFNRPQLNLVTLVHK